MKWRVEGRGCRGVWNCIKCQKKIQPSSSRAIYDGYVLYSRFFHIKLWDDQPLLCQNFILFVKRHSMPHFPLIKQFSLSHWLVQVKHGHKSGTLPPPPPVHFAAMLRGFAVTACQSAACKTCQRQPVWQTVRGIKRHRRGIKFKTCMFVCFFHIRCFCSRVSGPTHLTWNTHFCSKAANVWGKRGLMVGDPFQLRFLALLYFKQKSVFLPWVRQKANPALSYWAAVGSLGSSVTVGMELFLIYKKMHVQQLSCHWLYLLSATESGFIRTYSFMGQVGV